MEEIQKDPKWVKLFTDLSSMIDDEETLEKWVGLGVMIGIAVVTAGVGVYVEAVAGAAWGATSLAAFGATVGAESLTFTTLSTLLFSKDPSLAGILQDLGRVFFYLEPSGWLEQGIVPHLERQQVILSVRAERL